MKYIIRKMFFHARKMGFYSFSDNRNIKYYNAQKQVWTFNCSQHFCSSPNRDQIHWLCFRTSRKISMQFWNKKKQKEVPYLLPFPLNMLLNLTKTSTATEIIYYTIILPLIESQCLIQTLLKKPEYPLAVLTTTLTEFSEHSSNLMF